MIATGPDGIYMELPRIQLVLPVHGVSVQKGTDDYGEVHRVNLTVEQAGMLHEQLSEVLDDTDPRLWRKSRVRDDTRKEAAKKSKGEPSYL